MSRPAVRPATAADVPAVADLAARTFPLAAPPHVTRASLDEFIEQHLSAARFTDYLDDPTRDVLVADLGGQIVGYTLLVAGEPADADVRAAITVRPTVELSKLYVTPDLHGGGVAATLMDASLSLAGQHGAAAVWLGVNQQNERAQRFYTKSGFSRVGTKRFQVGAGLEHDYVYEQVLPAGASGRTPTTGET